MAIIPDHILSPASRDANRAAILLEVAQAAGSTLDLDEVLERVVEKTASLTGADRCSIWLLNAARDKLVSAALYGIDAAFAQRWKHTILDVNDERLSQEAIASGQPVVVVDAANDPRTDKYAVGLFGDKSILVVPMVNKGRVIGTLFLNHINNYYQFSPDDIEVTLAIASQAAVAIENAQLFDESRRRSNERLNAIFRNSSDAIVMIDRSLAIAAFNPAAESLTGWSQERAVGKPAAMVLTPAKPADGGDAPNPFVAATTALFEHGPTRAGVQAGMVEARVVSRLGEEHDVAASVAAVPAIEGDGPFALLVIRDVSRQKEVERLRSDFVSMVSHELRTPLAVIKGYAATLLNPQLKLDEERRLRFLRGINDATDRLTRLIDNILSVSRLESGRLRLNLQPVDLGDLAHRVIHTMRSQAVGHELRCEWPSEGVPVVADRDQIELVLVNLVANAIKYSPNGGDIVVEVTVDDGSRYHQLLEPSAAHRSHRNGSDGFGARDRWDEGSVDGTSDGTSDGANGNQTGWEAALRDVTPASWAVMSVRDQGVGIPVSQIGHVFDKFYRGEGPAVKRVSGTGLGLYICRSIVEAHDGRIWVESEPNQGSTFYIALPRRDGGAGC